MDDKKDYRARVLGFSQGGHLLVERLGDGSKIALSGLCTQPLAKLDFDSFTARANACILARREPQRCAIVLRMWHSLFLPSLCLFFPLCQLIFSRFMPAVLFLFVPPASGEEISVRPQP